MENTAVSHVNSKITRVCDCGLMPWREMKERGEEDCLWEGYRRVGAEHRSKAIEDKKARERSGGQI